jgi:type I restriction enzyme, S subunit
MTESLTLADVSSINPRPGRPAAEDDVVSFIGMADVDVNGTTTEGIDRPSSDVSKGYTQFRRGDILVAKITPCFENGKIAQALTRNSRAAGSTEFHVVRPKPGILSPRYLHHFLRQPRIRLEGERRMTGSAGQRRVPPSYLAGLQILLPSIEEQERIARILDQSDALLAKRQQSIALLDDLTQSIFLETFGDPASNPKRWEICTIGELIESATYGTSQKASLVGDFPVLRMGNITTRGEVDTSDLKYLPREEVAEKHTVHRGDILFNRTNSADLVGKTAVFRGEESMAYAGYLVRVRVNNLNDPEYISAFLNTDYGKRVLRGMARSIIGMANINARELQSIRIPAAPLGLQRDFAAKLRLVESRKKVQGSSLSGLSELFSSLQARAFSGEL